MLLMSNQSIYLLLIFSFIIKLISMKEYKCSQCNKVFYYSSLFNRHLITHTDQKPYKCDKCPKAFNRPDILKTHKNIHQKNAYMCCEKGFNSKASLRYHRKLVHEKKDQNSNRFQCKKLIQQDPVIKPQETQANIESLMVFSNDTQFWKDQITPEQLQIQFQEVLTPLRINEQSLLFYESMKLSLFQATANIL